MNLHEYQGKALFKEYGLPVSKGIVITDSNDAHKACREIGGSKWVAKAQVHAGGRGKSGGVKLVNNPDEAKEFAQNWLGKRLITYQTDAKGQLVSSILIEECTDIDKELYLAFSAITSNFIADISTLVGHSRLQALQETHNFMASNISADAIAF